MTRARSLSQLANSNVFTVDSTNSRVGIGSTIPDVKLDVGGNMNVSGTLTYEDVTNVETAGITTTGGLVVTGLGATIGGITTFFGDINFGAAGVGGTVTTLGHGGFTGIVTALGFQATGVITATSFRGPVTGNADTATTSTTSTNVTVADESSDTTCFPLFATAATGNLPPKSGTNLTFNSSSGALTATSFSGNINGGTVDGTTGTFTGNVQSGGSPIGGSANGSVLRSTGNISIAQGDYLGNPTNVLNVYTTGDSSVKLLLRNDGSAEFDGTVTLKSNLDMQDDDKILIGTGDDLQIYHNGSHSYIDDTGTGNLYIRGSTSLELGKYTGETFVKCTADGDVKLYYDDSVKLATSATGVTVTGTLNATTAVTQNGTALASTGKAIAMALIFG